MCGTRKLLRSLRERRITKIKILLTIIIASLGIAWLTITFDDVVPDEPILFIQKRKLRGRKYIYVAFRAHKKSPWRKIGKFYEEKAPNRRQMYQYALDIMDTPQYRNSFKGDRKEWNMMYNLIREEVNDESLD